MCTFVILRRPGADYPVLIAANRDEMIARPWLAPARHWPDRPEVLAGKDELAGGTWLGLNDHGVAAGILNRYGSLGPAPGARSRGELVLEALDHADAAEAAKALAAIDPKSYRSFNMIIADNRDAFWLSHADPSGDPVTLAALKPGLSMIAAGELDDDTPRLKRYRPRFLAAPLPDPARGQWKGWEGLLADDSADPKGDPQSAMRFMLESGFATVSSALIALPAPGKGLKPVFRFAAWQPQPAPWRDIPL
ncbi:MAG: NRDE family protein [Stellaceae bacterium]|jgi:uncharacterized protein with NRDE domain